MAICAIDTANPDGWGNILEYLKLTSADFVVGQESKRATRAECDTAESVARTADWKASLTHCLTTQATGKSAGVVVATRVRIGMSDAESVSRTQHLHDTGRFGMKHVGAVRKRGRSPRLHLSVPHDRSQSEAEPRLARNGGVHAGRPRRALVHWRRL